MALEGNRRFLLVYEEHNKQISFIKKHNKYLEEVANQDGLTGLYNFHYFQEAFPKLIEEANKNNKYLSICIIDVDNFKSINDKYGHEAGNEILISIAKNLREVVRKSDILLRLGGDEFAVLFPDVPAKDSKKIADRFLTALNDEHRQSRKYGPISCSIGISQLSSSCSVKEELIKAADKAMYNAKFNGGNQIIIADN